MFTEFWERLEPGLWVTMGVALLKSLLLAWSWCTVCTGQCYLTPSVTTRPSETKIYRTDELDLKTMMVSLLDYMAIIKEEFWGQYGANLTLTYPGDGSGVLLDIGFAVDAVAASKAVSMRLGSFYWGSHSFNDSHSCSHWWTTCSRGTWCCQCSWWSPSPSSPPPAPVGSHSTVHIYSSIFFCRKSSNTA